MPPSRLLALIFLVLIAMPAAKAQSDLHFEDLRNFAAAIAEIDDGASPLDAFTRYVERASPAFLAYAARYGTTAESIATEYERRPAYYRSLPELENYVLSRRSELDAALSRLEDLAPAGATVPVYFLVADQKAGGTPVQVDGADGPAINIAIAVDMIGLTAETDMSEFPDGTGGRANAHDLLQVAVHENAHVLQLAAQGGLANYRSIYSADTGNMLAIAVREGCAEYLTYLVSGWRLGDRHLYGNDHEAELWAEFATVANAPPFSAPGWFGGEHPDDPDRPSQIGYWIGSRICEHHHTQSADPDAATQSLFAVYAPDDVRLMAETYAASLSRR